MSYSTKVAARAAEFRPVRVLLSLLAFPFYVLGFAVGLLLVVVSWLYAAAAVGMSDARDRGVTDGAG